MNDTKKRHQELKILHFSMYTGLLILLLIFVFIFHDGHFGTPVLDLSPMTLIPIIISVLCLGFIQTYSKNMQSRMTTTDIYNEEQIMQYRSLKIMQWALIEGPALINGIFYSMFGNSIHLLAALVLWVILYLNKPMDVIH